MTKSEFDYWFIIKSIIISAILAFCMFIILEAIK